MIRKGIIIFVLLIDFTIHAQTFNKVKLDSLFSLMKEHNKGMGSISIYKEGKEIYQKTTGYLDIENKIEANTNTQYRIGSITKTFTATMIMQLVDEKKLKLEAFLSDYFPEVPNANKITVEHLLRHRSGLFNLTEDENFIEWMVVPNTRKQMMDRIVKRKVDFEPNEKTAYSNTNYILLSYIAEEIEGVSYSEVLESRILKPLKLKRTRYGQKINTRENEALSYVMEDSQWRLIKNETDMSVPVGAGSIISTPTELNIFFENLFYGKLVSDSSLAKMIDTSSGMGIGLSGNLFFLDKQAYGHSGGIDGFQSLTMYLPNERLSVSYIGNGVVISPNSCVINALKIYFNEEYNFLEFKNSLVLKTEELDLYLGVYVGQEFPFQITITKNDAILIADVKDGPTFPLDAYKKNGFQSDRAAATIVFIPTKNKMILDLGGKKSEFIRKQ